MASTIPSLLSYNLIRKSNAILPQLYTSSPSFVSYNHNLRWLSYSSPQEFSPKSPPEFPGPGHGKETIIPSTPLEVPEISTAPEIDPGSTPNEVVHTSPEEIGIPSIQPNPTPDPRPRPGPDIPMPPLDPPRGPDPLPPPMGPDIVPQPDRMPPDLPGGVPPLDPPRPIDPPGGPSIF